MKKLNLMKLISLNSFNNYPYFKNNAKKIQPNLKDTIIYSKKLWVHWARYLSIKPILIKPILLLKEFFMIKAKNKKLKKMLIKTLKIINKFIMNRPKYLGCLLMNLTCLSTQFKFQKVKFSQFKIFLINLKSINQYNSVYWNQKPNIMNSWFLRRLNKYYNILKRFLRKSEYL